MTTSILRPNKPNTDALNTRVKILGELSDRCHECRENGDAAGLLQIADEYDALNYMQRTAKLLRIEAKKMEKTK